MHTSQTFFSKKNSRVAYRNLAREINFKEANLGHLQSADLSGAEVERRKDESATLVRPLGGSGATGPARCCERELPVGS
jgi:hypothetical protein